MPHEITVMISPSKIVFRHLIILYNSILQTYINICHIIQFLKIIFIKISNKHTHSLTFHFIFFFFCKKKVIRVKRFSHKNHNSFTYPTVIFLMYFSFYIIEKTYITEYTRLLRYHIIISLLRATQLPIKQ